MLAGIFLYQFFTAESELLINYYLLNKQVLHTARLRHWKAMYYNLLYSCINSIDWLYMVLILVKIRINGTKNIAKITKSMKMVSAAKLRGDQQRLAAANPFAVSLT